MVPQKNTNNCSCISYPSISVLSSYFVLQCIALLFPLLTYCPPIALTSVSPSYFVLQYIALLFRPAADGPTILSSIDVIPIAHMCMPAYLPAIGNVGGHNVRP